MSLHKLKTIQTAIEIMQRWGFSSDHQAMLLQFNNIEYKIGSEKKSTLDSNSIECATEIICINEYICKIFSNPMNQNNFMNMANSNGQFAGESPLVFALNNGLPGLNYIRKHLHSLGT